ncbi:hypothetical protein [Streptomyces rugosispiralis]|uniref:Uncharacterized protein n=1 Tax=Streptomyces rugosispiralis TaxID=2967341 RepID=A0ABT1VDE9_9ACTN|nr:hypothetical protein [Streptomyces rugosispiralis]MCQ8195437.1 hypothetical protein [Streptomyces rugosispiralis]
MTTTRRPLGTGPSTTPSSPAGTAGGRRLVAERVELQELLEDPEPGEVEQRSRRRPLGKGAGA